MREGEAAFYLAFDIMQLSVLLYLTGGLQNPFALMLLAPVTVSATILGRKSTVNLCLLAMVCASLLTVSHLPLPWVETEFALPELYVTGIWCALVIALVHLGLVIGLVRRWLGIGQPLLQLPGEGVGAARHAEQHLVSVRVGVRVRVRVRVSRVRARHAEQHPVKIGPGLGLVG